MNPLTNIKMNYDDVSYILRYKKQHLFEKYFCQWTLVLNGEHAPVLNCDVKIALYIIFYPVILLISFVYSLLFSGIVHISIPERRVHSINVYKCYGEETMYSRLIETLERIGENK